MSEQSKFGYVISKHRNKLNITQGQLAKQLHLTHASISSWENDKTEPSIAQARKLAELFEISIDELVGRPPKKIAIFDTSCLIRRPLVLRESLSFFDKIIIPDIVAEELSNLKTKAIHRNNANLVIANINEIKQQEHSKLSVIDCPKEHLVGDRAIIALAKKIAQDPQVIVYLLSNDKDFPMFLEHDHQIKLRTLAQYAKELEQKQNNYDKKRSGEFYSLIANGKWQDAKNLLNKHSAAIDINMCCPESGYTPLISAVVHNKVNCIDFLLQLPDISLSAPDCAKFCFPPLIHAAQKGVFGIVKKLVGVGADINLGTMPYSGHVSPKNIGNTALMVAAWHGHTDIVKFLIDNGACTNQQDSNGFTALMKACIKCHESCIRLLCSVTDLSIRSRGNETPEDILMKCKDSKKLINILRTQEAL